MAALAARMGVARNLGARLAADQRLARDFILLGDARQDRKPLRIGNGLGAVAQVPSENEAPR